MHKFTDLNSVLDAMPRFLEHENSLKPRDPRATPIRSAADPTQPLVFFEKNGKRMLRSYETVVAFFDKNGKLHRTWGGWSATTGRHIYAFTGKHKAEWEKLPVELEPSL